VRREGREEGRVGIVVSRLEAPRALIYIWTAGEVGPSGEEGGERGREGGGGREGRRESGHHEHLLMLDGQGGGPLGEEGGEGGEGREGGRAEMSGKCECTQSVRE